MGMSPWNRIRRSIAGIVGAAGLAYPACAAICPKGHGSCPYPGKCFLYTDADTNSICDYTRTASSGSDATTASATTATAQPSASATTGNAAATVSPAGSTPAAATGTVPADTLAGNAPLIGIVLFLVVAAILFAFFRSGLFGAGLAKTGPALAVSSFVSLGISEIATYLLMGDAAFSSASYFAALYMLAGTLLAAYLWKEGAMTRPVALALSVLAVLFGFVLGALIMPAEFIGVANFVSGSQAMTAGIAAIIAVLALTVLVGRTFCAHVCPVGAVQELAYGLPVRKTAIRHTRIPEAIRLFVFASALLAALYALDIAGFTGAYDFFSLTLSTWAVLFTGLLVIAVFVYRPVCRAICPFGLLFSLAAQFSRYRLKRTGACTGCRRCEKACPAGAAGKDASNRE